MLVHTKVDPNRLSVAASNIENSLAMIERALNTVDDALHSELQPTWSGEASSAFFDRYSADSASFGSFIRDMRALNEQLKQASSAYDNADERASELVAALNIG